MQQRIALDVWYVDHLSLRLDVRIMIATISQILRGENAEPTVVVPVADLGWSGDAEPAARGADAGRDA